ncbi:RICIN domain-containing protein [Streptomyces sp. SP18CS02]|uniref:RICIN domain-containing protein n=1 Tax=Streptomyces sp. SP18CS02 TaxID=3002531 RepID=UPI002E76C4D0|nr:RICIN domain-containing protein [Streptomyces sp. SP18CS02]MEE1752700.1 RICIN domain-containing protein [Streptomyces sp. SP18CS02]
MHQRTKRTVTLFTALSATLLSALGTGGTVQAAQAPQPVPQSVENAAQFTTTEGKPLHAHGGGIVKVGRYYYWFGENRNPDNTFRAVSVYRSTDLKHWTFRNHVLTQASHPELRHANIERPKVIHNKRTGEFVMWMHKENGTDYTEARAAVATSTSVDGDYTWKGSFRPEGHMSRDISTFVDTDGTGYMISAANENADLHVYRLNDAYTGIQSLTQKLWVGQSREAPAMFKRGGIYFLLTSGATGWAPNQQKYATATSITGAWSELRDIGDSTTYRSQTAYVIPVQGVKGTGWLYMGDRWGDSMGGKVNDSQYVWLPLKFPTSTSMTMDYSPRVVIDTARGTVEGIKGTWETLSNRNSAKCADVGNFAMTNAAQLVQWGCGSAINQHFRFRKLPNGNHEIMARHSGKCLDISGASHKDGALAVQNTCNGKDSQQWKLRPTDDPGYLQIVARHSGKCLDVVNQSTTDGTALEQWTCNGGRNQHWQRTAV